MSIRKIVGVSAISNAKSLTALRQWLLPSDNIFASLSLHGNTKWSPRELVWLALCWGWSEARNVTDAFEVALEQCQHLNLKPMTTYQGFMKALVRWTDPLMQLLWPLLHEHMRKIGGRYWRIEGWIPIAFDGSRNTVPRSQSAERAFCAPNYGRGETAKYRYKRRKTKGKRSRKYEGSQRQPQEPQAWITLMWHMGLRLPWMWRLGPSNSSERTHVMEMLDEVRFPKNTLFCGDAGFIGYPLWERILSSGQHFLVRVGGNVRLLRGDKPIQEETFCWPDTAQRLNQRPLRLRLVKVRIGKTPMWMLTSVVDEQQLTKAQIVRFYKMRWGVELEFRGLKQTLNRGKIRCRNDNRALAELNWSLMAMAVAELFALKEQLSKRSRDEVPSKRSLAKTMQALRYCLRHLNEIPQPKQALPHQLKIAVTDDYKRINKQARYRPKNPDKKPLSDPKIRKLNQYERRKISEYSARSWAA